MKPLKQYLQEQQKECENNNIYYDSLIDFFKQEWFDVLCDHLKSGNTITQEIFDTLDSMQKWYINKHYLIHGIKCIV